MSEAEVWRTGPSGRGDVPPSPARCPPRGAIGISDRAALLFVLTLLGCAPAPDWIRPGRSLEENRADYAACQETTYRRLRAEFGYEVALSGSGVPGFASQNPIPPIPAQGSVAASSTQDITLRQDIDAARMQVDYRRQQLMRDCLTRAGFRMDEG